MVASRKTSPATVHRPTRPIEREKMRPWLMHLLLHENVTGLAWLSKKERTFRISWRHAAQQGWNAEKDADLFERWARHTGRHTFNDPKRWKANFRCALNSLPDVAEVREQGVKRGQNAFKVYKFMDEKKSKCTPTAITTTAQKAAEEVDVTCRFSRPRRTCIPNRRYTYDDSDGESMDYDSASSSASYSPSHAGSESGDDLPCSASDAESLPEARPVPDTDARDFPAFDKICPDYHIVIDTAKARRESVNSMASLDDAASTTSSTPTDEEVVEMLLADVMQSEIQHISTKEDTWTAGIVPEIAMEQDVETTYTILQNSAPPIFNLEYHLVMETDAVRTEQIPIGIQQETVYTSIQYL